MTMECQLDYVASTTILAIRQENEITCFLCGKRSNKKFHKPIKQLLQKGVLTDVNQATLQSAQLCDACHRQDVFADKSACTSDAALQRIIAKKAIEAESFAALNE